MARRTLTTCDRCKTTIDNNDWCYELEVARMRGFRTAREMTYHLCDFCHNAFKLFVNGQI